MITSRVLPWGEWSRVETRPPYAETGLPAQDGHWQIVVVEDDGLVVASCAIFDTVHWDAFHVDNTSRKNPAVFRALLEESLRALQDAGVPGAHITVPNDQPDLQAMVESFGFVEAPGKLYLYAVPERT